MKEDYNFKGFASFLETFKDDESCRKFLEYIFWQDKPVCSSCGHDKKIYRFKNGKTFKCPICQRKFTITVGTVFHSSHIPLKKWFIAIYLLSAHKNGISSCQLARDMEITQHNAWFMLHKIRKVIADSNHFKEMLEGIIECDETYVGGKNKNRHWDKKFKYSQGRSIVDKAPVFGILQRNGKVKVWVLKSLDGENMKRLIRDNVKAGSIICTDEYKSYRGLNRYFEHKVIDHSKGQHKVDEIYHTNNVENFWNFIKREIMGTYRKVDRFYLNRYAKEAAYRYNTRKLTDSARFVELLRDFGKYKITREDVYLRE